MTTATSHDVAKAFGKYQDEALTTDVVTVTRYGRPTVVIMSYREYQRLVAGQQRQREARRAAEMPDDLLAALDGVVEDTKRRLDEREAADASS